AIQLLFRIEWTRRQQVAHRLEPEQQAMKALQQRIVELLRDPRALVDTFLQTHVEPVRDLANTVLIQRPQQRQRSESQNGFEPYRLKERGRDREVDERAGFVPDAAVVACDHVKAIRAWRKVGIERLAAIANVLPLAIEAFEHVPEANLLGRHEAERRVIDLEVAGQWGQDQRRP